MLWGYLVGGRWTAWHAAISTQEPEYPYCLWSSLSSLSNTDNLSLTTPHPISLFSNNSLNTLATLLFLFSWAHISGSGMTPYLPTQCSVELECRLCWYVHSRLQSESGVDKEEPMTGAMLCLWQSEWCRGHWIIHIGYWDDGFRGQIGEKDAFGCHGAGTDTKWKLNM